MHNDEPTLLDILDRELLMQDIGKAVATCTPPQVFGVHGDWGLGKTSLLHQIQWYLTGECPQHSATGTKPAKGATKEDDVQKKQHWATLQVIWFDAWRYQNEATPIVALLHEIRAQFTWGQKFRKKLSSAGRIAQEGALQALGHITKQVGFHIDSTALRQANQAWETDHFETTLPSHTLREQLQDAISKLLPKIPKKKSSSKGKPPSRLVIFIDDLDRCEPRAAYRLLEGLKIYLTLDNCVFVLGMNQQVVEEAIGTQITQAKTPKDQEARAAAYMEKLCQNVWQLPAIHKPSVVLKKLLETTIKDKPNLQKWIISEIEEVEEKDSLCLPPNPRRLKGLANMIGRLAERFPGGSPEQSSLKIDPEKGALEAQRLVIVAYIHQFHHTLYVRWEMHLDLYEEIVDLCEGEERNPALPFLDEDKLVLPRQRARQRARQREIDDTDPSPQESGVSTFSTYPDPSDPRVFWIQLLIRKNGKQNKSEEFERYLRKIPAQGSPSS